MRVTFVTRIKRIPAKRPDVQRELETRMIVDILHGEIGRRYDKRGN